VKKNFEVRTDLALEVNEQIHREKGELHGVSINEIKDTKTDIKVTVLEITDKHGAKALQRPIGKYITVEAGGIGQSDDEYSHRAAVIIAKNIEELLEDCVDEKGKCEILVAGLGNEDVTADSLGPSVVGDIMINRHIAKDYDMKIDVAGISPGVMAQTGMETAEIIRGLVKQIKPNVVIAIDSLAARDTKRLNTTVQLSNQGIHPGSGVGNHRVGITEETVGVPVLAIGVPTVIDAPTIVNDTMERFLKAIAHSEELKSVSRIFSEYSRKEKYELVREVISPEMAEMYVTPKDIDANIKIIASTLAQAINIACEDIPHILT
jgi:spore protease